MSWQNRNSKILADETFAAYPFIQYVHDGSMLEPRSDTGGFAMPVEQAELLETAPAGAEVYTLTFRSGEETEVYFVDWLEIVPLTTRFAWIKDGVRLQEYVEGARGKLQLLAYVKDRDGNWAGPVMLTVKGTASKDLSAAVKQHRARVRKATRGKAPACYFPMLIHTGEPKLVGKRQKSRVTPIVLDEGEFDPDSAYVGDALADRIEQEWEEYKRWAEAWKNPGPNGEGEISEEDAEETTPKGLPERAVETYQEFQEWLSVRLPFRSQKYGAEATIGDLYDAGDVEALKALVAWCEQRPRHADVKEAALAALEALEKGDGGEAEEIPF
jgi:hypothetical protein